ncbi:hypothetical protein [Thioalkalivibrio thiocyanodenitrificans]|uniref:hypothetical protein n=1 Tax=Thioalkalivibrio thiocyanodenitrificans TaxID=243063 RepID=UPI00035C470C|nr:hypothetical protein [Thioalkalivibrio thiocyanodenitrificans]
MDSTAHRDQRKFPLHVEPPSSDTLAFERELIETAIDRLNWLFDFALGLAVMLALGVALGGLIMGAVALWGLALVILLSLIGSIPFYSNIRSKDGEAREGFLLFAVIFTAIVSTLILLETVDRLDLAGSDYGAAWLALIAILLALVGAIVAIRHNIHRGDALIERHKACTPLDAKAHAQEILRYAELAGVNDQIAAYAEGLRARRRAPTLGEYHAACAWASTEGERRQKAEELRSAEAVLETFVRG